MNQSFTAQLLTSERIRAPHFSDECFILKGYMPEKTYKQIIGATCPISEFLKIEQNRKNGVAVDVSPTPHIFNNSNHYYICMQYHQDDLLECTA
ncbi:hypothetical protein [Marinospirillum insulare]|uniref:Uncharacterized protein n=1 Tax=Marinospirillum insulare TaxID=217169 RepID=A0ABQ5ZX71_9GAMM|nr:hypothetical protein [Marinospirillum insulare]GLR63938.1 hypothetical protein GCM10007878_13760 [Marinospirillum insulare]